MKKLMTIVLIPLVLFPLLATGQDNDQPTMMISGKVINGEFDDPLSGCHVFLNDKLGTVVDEKGSFILSVPISLMEDPLYFTYVGFRTLSRSPHEFNGTDIEIIMQPEPIMLREVVVIGDPWKDFRKVILDLSVLYPDKEELIEAILEELRTIESTPLFEEELQ